MLVSGTSLLPAVQGSKSDHDAAVLRGTSQSFTTKLKRQSSGRVAPPVCGGRTQRPQQGRPQRRSWHHPGKVPDAKVLSHDRSTCPYRWKHLCQTNEQASSGSMCLGHKLRPCEKLAKEDKGDLGRVAAQTSATVMKEKLLHKTELTLLPGREVSRRRPASAPCLRKVPQGNGTTLGCDAAKPTMREVPLRKRASKTQQQIENEIEEAQATEMFKDVAVQPARPKSAPQSNRSDTSQARQSPQIRQQSAGKQTKQAPVRNDAHPSLGSALRVGTEYEHIARDRRHGELRQWPSGKTSQTTNTLPKRASRPQSAPASGVRPSVGSALRVGTEHEHIAREHYHEDLRQWPSGMSTPDVAKHIRSRKMPQDLEARLQLLEERYVFVQPTTSLA
jgi:hypothetical protein